ncbi:DUF799 domain-containing protein [Marinagarivorans algicola]|uniref:DUF799 domain-containing protein n=1 Tax=Marinagarivorans algicola TaxID=1513270 RepID=UPI0006B656E9|nr:GNA1162 family protein [Marinagarivorans algicola]
MKFFLSLFGCLLLAGCASAPHTPRADIVMPRSILVLPPVNDSVEVDAPSIFLSTVSKPLAERGYYVFPVDVVARLMRDNGMHTAVQMHQVPLDLLKQHTGAEAVLYVNIRQWGQKYQVVSSQAVVKADMKLVLSSTGATIWRGTARASHDSASNHNNLAEALIGAVVTQISGTLYDQTYELSREAIERSLGTLQEGPLLQEAQYLKGNR